MASDNTYIIDKFTAYKRDIVTANLSLAVWLVDDYTQNGPIGQVKVRIKEGDIKAKRNLDGYYLFIDLAAGNFTVLVESDLYFFEERVIDISQLNPKSPVTEIVLKPRPSYSFPNHATLLRGSVFDNGPVADAVLRVAGMPIESKTDKNGEFVLYFKGIGDGKITIEIKKYGTSKLIDTTIKERETKSLGILSFP